MKNRKKIDQLKIRRFFLDFFHFPIHLIIIIFNNEEKPSKKPLLLIRCDQHIQNNDNDDKSETNTDYNQC